MDCKYFKNCSVPVCPQDNNNCNWFPDENICDRKEYQRTLLIQNQKKIKNRARNKDTYYTKDMLNHDCIIGRAIDGIDPERDESVQLVKWFNSHKSKLLQVPRKIPVSVQKQQSMGHVEAII
jgi:hypothetical protein